MPDQAVEWPSCENCLIALKAPRDLRKKSYWFRWKKISQKLKYLNLYVNKAEDVFLCDSLGSIWSCPMRKFSLTTGEKCEWTPGFINLVQGLHKEIFVLTFKTYEPKQINSYQMKLCLSNAGSHAGLHYLCIYVSSHDTHVL